MFVGKPPGNYDRLLDFSRPVTGTLYFVPSATFLDDVAAAPAVAESEAQQPEPIQSDGSLAIGSLQKDAGKE